MANQRNSRVMRLSWKTGAGGFLGCGAITLLVIGLHAQPRPARTEAKPPRPSSLHTAGEAGQARRKSRKASGELPARLLALPILIRYESHHARTSPALLGAVIDADSGADAAGAAAPAAP